ncbi:MAG: penicillin-binding protein, partial [Lachnospiraceae bacterium]|nr:penicillin-binding protein [Lachnospiraceae bacterium]
MDYTYLGLEKIEDELIANTRRKESRIGAVLIRLVFLAFIAAVVTVGALGYGVIRGIIDDAPDVSTINISPSGFATFIYDTDGNQLQKLTAGDSNRTSVPLKNVPVSLRHAVVAIEDERFYEHNGIDPKGIIRAFFVGVRNRFHFNEGASTITQQLLKNNVFTGWTEEKSMTDRIKRKVQEQYLAVQLEKRLNDKDLILENYLNTINLGAGTYGVQAAAKKYFGKDVRDLTLSESAVIAGITKNPSKYNPIRHPEENAERRERILRKMVEQNYITEAEMQEALADNVYERIADA